jgi:cobalamin biosynthesis protein CobD/CbiB
MGNHVGLAAVMTCALFTLALGIEFAVADPPAKQAAVSQPAQCVSFDSEWRVAEAACATNVNLGRARALAREAETKCKSPEPAQHKLAAAKYQSALRLCRKAGAGH